MKPVYIFGHKNPDTDAVASAIALSYLKNKLGLTSSAKVIGELNRETKFVLDYFKVKNPSYLNDVRIKISDIKHYKNAYINENESIYSTIKRMQKDDLVALPLVNNTKNITGYITLKDITNYLVDNDTSIIKTNIDYLVEVLDAKILTKCEVEYDGNIKAVSFSTDKFINHVTLTNEDILIIGDRDEIIEHAITSGVKLLILTKNKKISDKLINEAIKNNVGIIVSSYSFYEVCNKIFLANYIKNICLINDPITISIDSYYTDFISLSKKHNYTAYPIINKKNECLGIIKYTDITNYIKNKVILVDHNNYEQSVDGLNEAEILEVYDHHNIGDIGSNSPIYYTCMPVGSTCTIIYEQFIKENIDIPYEIAGLMLSAIISDTLLLTSPTTTKKDIDYAKKLAKLIHIDLKKYGLEMLKVGGSISGLTPTELIYHDFKTYNIDSNTFGIAVITSMDFNYISKDINLYVDKLNEMVKGDYKSVIIFIVDIMKKGSYILYNEDSENLIKNAFNLDKVYEGVFVKDLMSRKKQIIPAIMGEFDR